LVPDDDGPVTAMVMIPPGVKVSDEEVDSAIAAARAQDPGQPFVFVDMRPPDSRPVKVAGAK
jgi:hypothetical protein